MLETPKKQLDNFLEEQGYPHLVSYFWMKLMLWQNRDPMILNKIKAIQEEEEWVKER